MEWLQMNLNDFISLKYHLRKNISFKYCLTSKTSLKFHLTLKNLIKASFKATKNLPFIQNLSHSHLKNWNFLKKRWHEKYHSS
jgi:hypothetical protein